MGAAYVKPVVRHAILTAFALDIIGFALSGYGVDSIDYWCRSRRDYIPPHKNNSLLNGRGSFNTFFCAQLFSVFSDINPCYQEDLPEVETEVKDRITVLRSNRAYKQIVDTNMFVEDVDTGLVLSVGVSCGFYAILNDLSIDFMFGLTDAVLNCTKLNESLHNTAKTIAYSMYRLIQAGYFCEEFVDELIVFDILPPVLKSPLIEMRDNMFDLDYLKSDCYVDDALCQSQKTILESFFYMSRVAYANTKELKCLPRDQLKYILTSNNTKPEDAGFLYGAICAASEHEHPLIVKPLRESVEFKEIIDESFLYFGNSV